MRASSRAAVSAPLLVTTLTLAGCTPAHAPSPSSGGARLDTGAWLAANIGNDGAPGAPSFCASIARLPEAFDVGPHRRVEFRIAVSIRIPRGDLTRAYATSRVTTNEHGRVIPERGRAWIEGALDEAVAALRNRGGTASSATLDAEVRCEVQGTNPPRSSEKLQWLSNLR